MAIQLKKRIVLSKSTIFQFLLMFPFMEPALFREIGVIHNFYMAYKILVTGIVILMYTLNKVKPSKVLILISIYEFIILFSTIINSGNIIGVFSNVIATISVCALIEYYIKKNTASISTIIYYTFALFTIINMFDVFITSILSEVSFEGYVFFLGKDNRFVFIFLPMIAMGAISIKLRNKNKLFLVLVSAIAFLTLLYSWSVAAALVMGALTIYLMLTDVNNSKSPKLTLPIYFLLIIIFNILIVFMQVQFYFYDFIVNVLHKDVSLSGRIFLWEIGIEKILQSPFIGYGVNEYAVSKLLDGLVHFHNYFINMLYQSGFLNMIVFVLMNIIVMIKTHNYKSSYVYKVVSTLIFVSLVLSVFDTLDYTFFYVFYIILYNIDYIEKNEFKMHPEKNIVWLLNMLSKKTIITYVDGEYYEKR